MAQRSTLERWLPITGILAVVLALVSIFGESTPDNDASTAKVNAYYVLHDDRMLSGAIMVALVGVLFLFFAGALRSTLARAEGDVHTVSTIAFAGGVTFAIGMLVFAGFQLALSETAGDVPPQVLQAVHVAGSDTFFAPLGGTAVMLLASGIAVVRTGGLPRWLGWVALVLGVAMLTPVSWFGFLLGLLWVVAAAIAMIVRGGTPAEASLAPDQLA